MSNSMEGQSVASDKMRFIESKKKLRISHDVPNSSGCQLIAAANNHSMILVGSQDDNSIKGIAFDQVIDFKQTKSDTVDVSQFKFILPLNFKPNIVSVDNSILLVIGQSVLEAFDLDNRTSIGRIDALDIIDYAWHPNHPSPLVALCTKHGELLLVTINQRDKNVTLVYRSQEYGVMSCCWSPKGKNLAIGMSNGRVKRLEPVITASSFTLKDVEKSLITFPNSRLTPQHRIAKLRWINKTHLLSIHTGPETIYSMFTVKPTAPYKYWTSICFEGQPVQEQNYFAANMVDAVVCASAASGEAAVLGLDGEEWKTIIIEEEGARIELPLDSNSSETFPRGLTIARLDKHSVLIFYTSAGLLCAYAINDVSGIVQSIASIVATTAAPTVTPTIAPTSLGPPVLPTSVTTFNPTIVPTVKPSIIQSVVPSTTPTISTSVSSAAPTTRPDPALLVRASALASELSRDIASIKVEKNFDLAHVNVIRRELAEIEDIHKMHREAVDAIAKDIESLDSGMLENLYLIEYIKTYSNKRMKKRYIDPATQSKVESMRAKMEGISHKLREVNIHVDTEWNLYNMRKSSNNKLDSLEMVYKTLATQQKIINSLKKKVSIPVKDSSPQRINNETQIQTRELDPVRLCAFKEFLASRDTVPIRRPE